MTLPLLQVVTLPHAEGLPLPAYASAEAAGLDLLAALPADTPVEIGPSRRAAIPTGLLIAIPPGHEGQVRPRSGLARNHGLTVLNSPGTIDSDYRGEVQVLLINLGAEPFTIRRGMRIAQLVVAPVTRVEVVARATLDPTRRGDGGFGSTGV
ncbi:MAG: dUTP diphosphatase [Bauldia sp.]